MGPARGGYGGRVRPPGHVIWRRRLTAVGALLGVVAVAAVLLGSGQGEDPGERASAPAGEGEPPPPPPKPPELPRGGRSLFPEHRVVGYYGAPQDEELGALGIGTPDGAARRLEKAAKPYDGRRRSALPALELITVIALADAGEDGKYRARQEDEVIRRYLRAARRAKALLVLDIQPGRSDFFTETTRLRKYLREPDVGLALDPEWRVTDSEVPGQVIGRVSSREVNATTAWLDQLTARHDLPEKLVVIHQFTDDMVDEQALKPRDGLAIVLNADGFGGREIKRQKYHAFTRQAPGFHQGFKLFYQEDVNLMAPRNVMRMRPPPDFIVYE
jgi:hypothetical protein